jgi:hypothetical protein
MVAFLNNLDYYLRIACCTISLKSPSMFNSWTEKFEVFDRLVFLATNFELSSILKGPISILT